MSASAAAVAKPEPAGRRRGGADGAARDGHSADHFEGHGTPIPPAAAVA